MRLRSNTAGLAFRFRMTKHVGDRRAEFSIQPVVTEETAGAAFFVRMKEGP
jgi:hypothetical protein